MLYGVKVLTNDGWLLRWPTYTTPEKAQVLASDIERTDNDVIRAEVVRLLSVPPPATDLYAKFAEIMRSIRSMSPIQTESLEAEVVRLAKLNGEAATKIREQTMRINKLEDVLHMHGWKEP